MSIFEKFEQHADKTFAFAAEAYLADFQGVDKKRVIAAIDSTLPYIGKLRLIDVDDETLAQFKRDRRAGAGHFERPAMVGTVNKELTQVITILNYACRIKRWIPSIPKFVQLIGESRRGYPLTWDEQDRLFAQFPTGFDVLAAGFAINTGVRKEELFGLEWTDRVDIPDLNTFVFVLNRTKNGHSRAVIVNSLARRCVEQSDRWQEKNGRDAFVFPKKLCPSANGKTWITAWKRAGMPDDPLIKRGCHNTRHTFGHRLRAADVSAEDRNALLGHSNTNLAQHYALPDIKRLLELSERITVRRDTALIRSAHHSKPSVQANGRPS